MEDGGTAQEYKQAFEAALRLCAKHSWRPNYICEVKSVDRDTRTCEAESTGGETSFPEARLRAVQNDDTDYVVQYPKVGSLVVVELLVGIDTQAVVTAYSVVEEIDVVIGKTTINVKDGLIKLNGGGKDGLVLVNPLVSVIKEIKEDINKLKTAFSGWVPVPQDGGAALKSAAQSWASQQLGATTKDDLQNKKITQG